MKDYSPLKTKKIYKETKIWIPRNVDFIYEKRIKELGMYLNDEDLVSGFGTVIGACSQLALWYEQLFIIDVFEEKENSFSHLLRSFKYDFWAVQIQAAVRVSNVNKQMMSLSIRDHGLILSKGIALGCLQDSESLGRTALSNLDKHWYAGLDFIKVAPFILQLFSSWKFGLWKGVDYPELNDLPQCYKTILATWREEKSIELENALLAACDYHIEESRFDTRKKYYEFNDYLYRVFPAEILAVLQLRKDLNLELPEIKHDLFTLPTVKLCDHNLNFEDSLIEKVKEKASKELNLIF